MMIIAHERILGRMLGAGRARQIMDVIFYIHGGEVVYRIRIHIGPLCGYQAF